MTPLQIREIFGNPKPPSLIWEKQFDGFDEELTKLGKSEWHLISDPDLWVYLHDLCYVELQPDLFAHLFPVCLNFWYNTLMRSKDATRGDSDFHRSLLRGQILKKMVTPRQRDQIYDFMVGAFIERLERERGFIYTGSGTPAYAWMGRFNSLAMVAPLTQRIWESWWSLDHPGKAVCALMWGSGLVYDSGENPIFKTWTPTNGGGGPYLTESDSLIYDAGWLPENFRFLQTTLTNEYLQSKLLQAADVLRGEPENHVAREMANQAQKRAATIETRLAALFQGLNSTSSDQYPDDLW